MDAETLWRAVLAVVRAHDAQCLDDGNAKDILMAIFRACQEKK